MAENSKIEWCDHTFNPWIGCTRVSPGCQHCYAETLMDQRWRKVDWGPQGQRKRTSQANWRKPLAWNRRANAQGTRYRVFCGSLCDVFEEKPDQPELLDWLRDLLDMIIHTPYLDWLLLTKRPENVCRRIELATGFSDADMWFHAARNVWMGTSVENQEYADERIGHLMYVPAQMRFLSCEPLLGPLDIEGYLSMPGFSGIGWVIVGGESGPNCRPMQLEWARYLRDQCQRNSAAYFFKQTGGHPNKGASLDAIPEDLRIREFPQPLRMI